MKIHAIKCKGCGDIVFSRSVHDMRFCSCSKTAKDGGWDYDKISFDPKVGYEIVELDLQVTKRELYDDWNNGTDKYGLILATKTIIPKQNKPEGITCIICHKPIEKKNKKNKMSKYNSNMHAKCQPRPAFASK